MLIGSMALSVSCNPSNPDATGTWYSRQAIDFLNRPKDGKFVLWIGFHEPHAPFNFPVEYSSTLR
jgi:hypothetical protein